MMAVHPILAALRKHKAGVILIMIQISLTLAIVCNVAYIITLRIELMHHSTGLDEHDLFLVAQSYVGNYSGDDQSAMNKLDSMQLTDLSVLRNLPDVKLVTPVNTLPLLRYVWSGSVALGLGQAHGSAHANYFKGDQYLLPTLGLRLIAGRNFSEADVENHPARGNFPPAVVIVTKALADKLFPNGNALGSAVYLDKMTSPSVIVGVVEKMFSANPDDDSPSAWYSILIPSRVDSASTMYAVRSQRGRIQPAIRESRDALFKVNPMRVIDEGDRFNFNGIHTYAQIRDLGYAIDVFTAEVLAFVCVILLLVTGVGIAGLTNFWVRQRYKQIGIRRALGARRIDILHYFQVENLVIVSGGCIVGIVLTLCINIALMQVFATSRIPVWYVLAGVLVVILLGQISAFMPARRASNVSPMMATRGM
ncbi:FtsX-like permease family protein [Oleiagrimonas sp. C23AA]|uniref:ABC transporter permease n=1 Tax=Oleiagrimonas sp. C23AA TaxID=2719047 RepID=UPI001F0FF9AB|nr:FtsX-like permease family protein [Oleiagrimonas sp. C23AA]